LSDARLMLGACDRLFDTLRDIVDSISKGTEYEKAQIGKYKDRKKIIGKMVIREKIILVGKINESETRQNKQKTKGHHKAVIDPLFC
jgi:hypothetical protein